MNFLAFTKSMLAVLHIYNTCLNYKLQEDKVTNRRSLKYKRSLSLTIVLPTSLIVICTTLLSFGIQSLLFITTSLDSYVGVVVDLVLNINFSYSRGERERENYRREHAFMVLRKYLIIFQEGENHINFSNINS